MRLCGNFPKKIFMSSIKILFNLFIQCIAHFSNSRWCKYFWTTSQKWGDEQTNKMMNTKNVDKQWDYHLIFLHPSEFTQQHGWRHLQKLSHLVRMFTCPNVWLRLLTRHIRSWTSGKVSFRQSRISIPSDFIHLCLYTEEHRASVRSLCKQSFIISVGGVWHSPVSLWCKLSYLVSGPSRERKKMAAVEKEMEESLRSELSAWDPRVVEPDSVTLHPWETGEIWPWG